MFIINFLIQISNKRNFLLINFHHATADLAIIELYL